MTSVTTILIVNVRTSVAVFDSRINFKLSSDPGRFVMSTTATKHPITASYASIRENMQQTIVVRELLYLERVEAAVSSFLVY